MNANERDLISIIVPVFNAEKYIETCVGSIQKQSYSNFELILIDDGSKDDSLRICKEFEQQDKRVIVLHRENGGVSAARNTGLSICEGDYIVFIDSDDFVSPNYLENLHSAAIEGKYDIVQCDLERTNQLDFCPKNVLFSCDDVKCITKVEALNKRMFKVCIWGKIYSAEVLKDFRFEEGIINEDDASYYILVDRAERIALLKETLYYYYMSENSIMRSKKNISLDFIKIYEDRIRYFKNSEKQELLDGTYARFCLVLMLIYASSVKNRRNQEGLISFLNLFKKYYPLVMKSSSISIKDKMMFKMFRISPNICGYFIGKIRE